MVSEANEPGSESGKRSDAPQEGGANNHLAARLPPRAPGSFAAAAMITRTASQEPTRGSEHLFEEGGDVVAAAVQHRADELHARPLEAAAGAFDLGNTGAIGLDHDQCGVE